MTDLTQRVAPTSTTSTNTNNIPGQPPADTQESKERKMQEMSTILCEEYFNIIEKMPASDLMSERLIITSFLTAIASILDKENKNRSPEQSHAHIDAIVSFMNSLRSSTIHS